MTKKLSIWGIAVTFFLALLVFISPTAFAENEKDLSDKVEKLEQKVDKLSAKDDSYDYLKEETKSYRQFVEKEWEMFLYTFISFLTIGVTGVSGVLVYFNIQSRKDVENLQKEIKEEAEREFNNVKRSVVTNLQSRVDSLEKMIEKEVWFQNSNILALDRGQLEEILSLSPLNKNNIKYATPPLNNLSDLLAKKEVDIVVYEYDIKNEEDSHIAGIIDKLRKHSEPIPIVIYYPKRGHLKNKDIDRYKWHLFANSPVTLVTHTRSLVHFFR